MPGAEHSLEVVATEKWAIGDKDLTAQLLKARALGAQAVLIWGIGPELAAIANGMARLGYEVPLIGGWPLSMSNFLDNAGAAGNGALMPQTFIEEATAQGYGAVPIFAAAVKQAGSTDSLEIRAALEVADHAYVMERGRIAVEGTPAELSRDERVLAAYLG